MDKKLDEQYKVYNNLIEKRKILMDRFEKLESMEKELDNNKELSSELRLKNKKKLLDEYNKISTLLNGLCTQAEKLAKELGIEE